MCVCESVYIYICTYVRSVHMYIYIYIYVQFMCGELSPPISSFYFMQVFESRKQNLRIILGHAQICFKTGRFDHQRRQAWFPRVPSSAAFVCLIFFKDGIFTLFRNRNIVSFCPWVSIGVWRVFVSQLAFVESAWLSCILKPPGV